METRKFILLIRSEIAVKSLLPVALEADNYQLTLADEGQQGMNLAPEKTPDLVLLDLGIKLSPIEYSLLVLPVRSESKVETCQFLTTFTSNIDLLRSIL